MKFITATLSLAIQSIAYGQSTVQNQDNSIEIIKILMSGIALLISIIGIILTVINTQKQKELQKQLEEGKKEFSQRQIILQLWSHAKDFPMINKSPEEPSDFNNILKAMDFIELVAACWAKKIVEQDLIDLLFGKLIIENYNVISNIHKKIPGYSKDMTISHLLSDNNIVKPFIIQITEYRAKKDTAQSNLVMNTTNNTR